MGVSIFDEFQPYDFGNQIVAADTTGSKAATGTEAFIRRIDTITATNTDTIDHVISVRKVIGGTTRNMGSATIPLGAGTAGAPTVDLLALALPATQVGIVLLSGESLTVALEVTLGAAKTIDLVASGGLV